MPPAPDYSRASAWLMQGTGQGTPVFYLHPTTYAGERWNAAIDEAQAQPGLHDVLETHTSVFAGCCAVWAPRYRQAGIAAVTDRTGEGQAAYARAYVDVEVAFREFLARIGSRPFVLAGHSQGSFHLRRLLEERVVPEPQLRERLVSAYVIGIGIPKALFVDGESLSELAPCRSSRQHRCVISWNLFTDDAGARDFARMLASRYPDAISRTSETEVLCVNPISGRADEVEMPAQSHPGAWMPGTAEPAAGVTGLVCRDGALIVTGQLDPAWMAAAFAGGNLHMMDYRLTYTAMQRDVSRRIDAYCSHHGCM